MYNEVMSTKDNQRRLIQLGTPEQRLREAIAMHEIEGNPLTEEDIAMFEMFQRENWAHEKRRAYIIEQSRLRRSIPDAAE